jgi:hypothetical protein
MLKKRSIDIDFSEKDLLVVPHNISHRIMLSSAEFLLKKPPFYGNQVPLWYAYLDYDDIDIPFLRSIAINARYLLQSLNAISYPDIIVCSNLDSTIKDEHVEKVRRAHNYITEIEFYSLCYKRIFERDGKVQLLEDILNNASNLHGLREDTVTGVPLSVVQAYK